MLSCTVHNCNRDVFVIADYREKKNVELCEIDFAKEHWRKDAQNVRVVS